jgi:hypothetical protein
MTAGRRGVALTPTETRRDVIVRPAMLADELGYEVFATPGAGPQRRASLLRSGPRNPPPRPAKPNGRGLLIVGKRAGTGRVLSGAGPGGRCEIFGQLGCERVRQTRGEPGVTPAVRL